MIYELALKNTERTNRALVRVYLVVQKEIEDELKRFFDSVDPSWSKQYQAKRLSEIFKTVNQKLSVLTGISTDKIETAFLGQYKDIFSNYAYNLSDYYSGAALQLGFAMLPFTQIDESVIKAALNAKIGEYSFKKSMVEKQAYLRQKLREDVAVSITKGEGTAKLTKRLQESFQSGISKYVATARTEMLKAFSLAQDESIKQAQDLGIEFSYQWLSASDGRTRETHAAENGKFAVEFRKDGTPIFKVGRSKGPGPRLLTGPDQAAQNINCRCRRLNIPFKVDTSQQFPTTNDKPDYSKYLKMVS
jgi:SPP1 gp7 family putative phage head morphogenesis protein